MANYIDGINLKILKWARERSGFSAEAAAKVLSKTESFIHECESGDRALTYVQLETLAEKYKRTIAMFFLPEIPDEPDISEKLSLRKTDVEQLNPRVHILFRQAYARQLSLMELNHGTNPSKNNIFQDIQAQRNDSPSELAEIVRIYLNISLHEQLGWKNSTDALKNWRECIEENGIFVFKNAFKDDSVDGFCLEHPVFPVIYLNNSKPKVRQTFTLFHELGHILLGKNGITRGINPQGGSIETFCNKFAAEFLAPSNDLKSHLKQSDNYYDDEIIEELASRYKVSRPVILLKLVQQGKLTNNDYMRRVKGWETLYESQQEKKSSEDSPGGGSFYNTQYAYLGYKYMELAFNKYRQGECSIEQLADHLNVKVKQIPQFEELLLKRVVS